MKENVSSVVKSDLCLGCGSCYSICPKKCISLETKNFVRPIIDETKCVKCGLCKKVCPGLNPITNNN